MGLGRIAVCPDSYQFDPIFVRSLTVIFQGQNSGKLLFVTTNRTLHFSDH